VKALKIAKWGNSAALRLPAKLLHDAGFDLGDTVEVTKTKEGILIRERKKSIADMSIDEILAKTSPAAVKFSRSINRDAMAKRPAGEEII